MRHQVVVEGNQLLGADFYLDKYEATVGRFRQFVNARKGTAASPPVAGDGAHPMLANSGWDSAWNGNLAADTASLKAALKCDPSFETWTDDALGGNESLPQNCMNWYEAFAFCESRHLKNGLMWLAWRPWRFESIL
jgi:formylglycine-generating enzyme required for sulfatase activity